jgi:hypothetical protein
MLSSSAILANCGPRRDCHNAQAQAPLALKPPICASRNSEIDQGRE